jgi:cell division protein FtsL
MDRLEIERQLQRHEQQLNSNNNQKVQISFWNFNNNNNTQIFIKALFLLLLSISGGFTSKTLGCGTQKAFQNMTTKHMILFALIYFTLDISENPDQAPIHPYEQFKKAVILYIGFILFTKMNLYFTMIAFGLLCISYIIGNYVKNLDWHINNINKKQKRTQEEDKTLSDYELLKKQSSKYQEYINYAVSGVVIVGSLSYLLKKRKEYGSRFSYITFFQGVSKCDSL